MAQITGATKISRNEMTRIAMAHKMRQMYGRTICNYAYHHAIIPSKEVVHRHMLPASVVFEEHGKRPVQQYIDSGLTALWQPFYEPSLLEPEGSQRFYPRTDSHWSHGGALRYVQAFLERSSPELAKGMEAIVTRRFAGQQQGDLGLKLELPPETIEIVAPTQGTGRPVFENGIHNEGCVRWSRNLARNKAPRALIMHDSFTMWLLSVLPELFSEVLFIHGTVFDYEFVRCFAPDVVLCIQAERFFIRAPETGSNLLRYVSEQEAEKSAPRRFIEFLRTDPRFAAITG